MNRNKMKSILSLSGIVLVISTYGQISLGNDLPTMPQVSPGPFVLTEKWLVEEGSKQSTNLKSIELRALEATINRESFDDNFSTNLIGSATYSSTDIKDASSPLGKVSPIARISTGVQKVFNHGASIKGEVFQTNTEFQDANAPLPSENSSQGFLIELGIDLGANRFGRKQKLGKFQLESVEQLSLAQKNYQTNNYRNALRKIYWSLVANKRARKWRMELLSSARRQLTLIRKQKDEFVSDAEDVARFEALVLSQRSELINLDNQFQQLVLSLKSTIPSLTAKDISLDLVGIESERDKILSCIENVKNVPTNTLIDTTSLKEVLKNQYIIYKASDEQQNLHDSYELNLFANYESSTNQEFDQTTLKFSEDAKGKSTIGLQFSMPLGSQKSNSKNRKKQLLKANYLNDSQIIINNLTSKREASLKQIKLLADSLEILEKMTRVNQKKLRLSRKKYDQARIPLAILIQDEENLLVSNLQQVQLRLQVVHTLLDYLSVYDKTNCEFNNRYASN